VDCFVLRETSQKLKRGGAQNPRPFGLAQGRLFENREDQGSLGWEVSARSRVPAWPREIAHTRLLLPVCSAKSLRYVVVDCVWWSAFLVAFARTALG
jgi:hypothetical protein